MGGGATSERSPKILSFKNYFRQLFRPCIDDRRANARSTVDARPDQFEIMCDATSMNTRRNSHQHT
jgi:hypothetical protein